MVLSTSIKDKVIRNLSSLYKPADTEIMDAFLTAVSEALDSPDGVLAEFVDGQLQLTVLQSEDFFANLWGEYFGLPRFGSETDQAYTQRQIDEALQIRVSVEGILNIMSKYFKDAVLKEWAGTGFVVSDNSSGALGSYLGSVIFGDDGLPEDWRTPYALYDEQRGAYAELLVVPVSFAQYSFHCAPALDPSDPLVNGDDTNTPSAPGAPTQYGFRGHCIGGSSPDPKINGDDVGELVNRNGGFYLIETAALSRVADNRIIINVLNRNRAAGVRIQIRINKGTHDPLRFRLGISSGFVIDPANELLKFYINDTQKAELDATNLKIAGDIKFETLDAGDPLKTFGLGKDSTVSEGKAIIISHITQSSTTRLMEIRENGDIAIETGSSLNESVALGLSSGGFLNETASAIEMLTNVLPSTLPTEIQLRLDKAVGDLDLRGTLLINQTF